VSGGVEAVRGGVKPVGDQASAPSANVPRPGKPRVNAFNVTLTLFAIAVMFSVPALRGSGRDLDYFANLVGFLERFFPPNFTDWRLIGEALIETFQIAVIATLISVLVSLPVAMAASLNIAPGWVVRVARFLLVCVRSIPGLIWALIAVAVCGANPLAGVVGLAIYSVGYLGKFFSDSFESIDSGVADGLRATGADAVQRFQYGIWPHAKPLVWSQTLWMLEYNIRSASIIGYVGAGGIGVWLQTYQELSRWDRFCAVLLCILAVVLVLDYAGERIRKQFSP
jgi:phosphonate transport system permease protein